MSSTDIREYELVYIMQADIDPTTISEFQERVAQAITSQQGEVLSTEVWGRRNLAYPIQKQVVGHYVLQRFQMAPEGTVELERLLRFNENVMRFLVMRGDE